MVSETEKTRVNADEAKALANSVYQKALDPFFITYLGCWKREDPPDAQSTAIVSGALVTALITVAARIAIDLDLSEDQLSSILIESYVAAEAGAPRWG